MTLPANMTACPKALRSCPLVAISPASPAPAAACCLGVSPVRFCTRLPTANSARSAASASLSAPFWMPRSGAPESVAIRRISRKLIAAPPAMGMALSGSATIEPSMDTAS